MFRCSFIFVIAIFIFGENLAQNQQVGGFSEGWDSYNNTTTDGLGPRVINYNYNGLRIIDSVPEVGVHPRVYFGPTEIPEIKNRLDNTLSGQQVKAQIHAYTTLLHLGYPNGYNHNDDYGKDDYGNRRIDNAGKWNANPQYYQLISHDTTVWDGIEIKRKHITSSIMALEAFECLLHQGEVDSDTGLTYDERAIMLARAMTFWAGLAIADPDVTPDKFNNFGGVHMALAYDMNYNMMTSTQRDSVRQALVKIIGSEPRHGAWIESYVATSNWAALNSFEVLTNLAIEGESGYNAGLSERWMRAYHNFINYGWYPSGAGYEGLGKNYMFLTTGIALAKRGYSLLAHPNVKAYGTKFLPAIMQPFGHGFTSYDVWGGSGYDDQSGGYKFNASDIVGLKYIFPEEPKIDFLWRNYIEKSHDLSSEGYVYQQITPDDSYHNYLLVAGIFSADYNSSQGWNAQANDQVEEDFFAADRGLVIAKVGRDSTALSLQFHCRQDLGGHTHGDRNDFTLSALGRIWIRKSYSGSQFQPSWFHSCVLVDSLALGVGDPDGDKCRQPGKILEYESNPGYTKMAGDATLAYSYEWHWSPQSAGADHPWLGSDSWETVDDTWNDYQFYPSDEAHYNLRFYDVPHWTQPFKFERMIKRPYNFMEKVYRTIGVVKGDRPYVIIVDDIKKDSESHNYQWLGQIARDLVIESTYVNLTNQDYRADIILKEPASEGDRRLLVRVLSNENYDGSTAPAIMDTLEYFDYFTGVPYNSNPSLIRPRLIVSSESIEPHFKILLLPYIDGDVLPVTNWNIGHDTLELIFPGKVDQFAFVENAVGRTEIELLGDCGIVKNTKNSGPGSLREVLSCIDDGEEIQFSPLLKDSTILLELNSLVFDKNVRIKVDPLLNIIINAKDPLTSNFVNLMHIETGNTVEISGVTIVGAFGPSGAAILNEGHLILEDVQLETGSSNINSLIENSMTGTLVTKGCTKVE